MKSKLSTLPYVLEQSGRRRTEKNEQIIGGERRKIMVNSEPSNGLDLCVGAYMEEDVRSSLTSNGEE